MPKQYRFTERGKSPEEVINRINDKYEGQATIQVRRKIPASGLSGILFGRKQFEYKGYVTRSADSLMSQKKQDAENRDAILKANGKTAMVPQTPEPETAADSAVLREIRELKEQLAPPSFQPFPVLSELEEILVLNDFDRPYIKGILDALQGRHTAAQLGDRALIHRSAVELMAGGLDFCRDMPSRGVYVLVGPTGVGKTTTVAKLAAVFGLNKHHRQDVRIMTIDCYRIGARDQVEKYGELMDIPVTAADSYDELKRHIALASDADLILVDTIGSSPRDDQKMDEMHRLLSACGDDARVHLALSATTKPADLKIILKQFKQFNYQSVLITKLDETAHAGNLISAVSAANVPLSYLTYGQSVPLDIAEASPHQLLSGLEGLDASAFKNLETAADLTADWR